VNCRTTDDGGAAISARGVCWSESPDPEISDAATTEGSGVGNYTSEITGLNCNTTYYVRAYATNSAGTSYGQEITFSTGECPTGLPSLNTNPVTSIYRYSAQGGGEITDNGGSAIFTRGICWSTTPDPDTTDNRTEEGSGIGSFTSVMDGLQCDTRYYVRAYATNAYGTVYGMQVDFFTEACPSEPVISTGAVTDITESSASCSGVISDNGGEEVMERGLCWHTSPGPTIHDQKVTEGSGTGYFSATIEGISQLTTYYVRAYATNSQGTSYGEERSFTSYGTLTDWEGNSYRTLVIGTQVWMQENLKATRLNDGTYVSGPTNMDNWENWSGARYCYYNFENTNKETLGALYHFEVVMTNKICPSGWHVPAPGDWDALLSFLGGASVAGGKMKLEGTGYWRKPNLGGSNESGFSARAVGILGTYLGFPVFDDLNEGTGFWMSTGNQYVSLNYDREEALVRTAESYYGMSIRCVRDD
jgi:uncharacterized protein (TIGR02145 family)